MSRFSVIVCSLVLTLLAQTAYCETALLHPFVPGSYRQMLDNHAGKPFMLVIWSVTCSSCLKDMALLNKMHKANPKIDIVMLSTDDSTVTDDIQKILTKNELNGLENWYFADENPQKLRYEIDPKWYGELPRTYFVGKNNGREGVSGVLTQENYEQMFKKILN